MTVDFKLLAKIITDIERVQGKGSIYLLGSKSETLEVPRKTSGIPDFDYIMGGGVPSGRLLEIYGPDGAGKTSLAYQIAAQYQSEGEIVAFIDAEGTFDSARARLAGVRKKKLMYYAPDTGEQAIKAAMNFAKAMVPLVIIDSVPALIPKKAMENTDPEKFTGMAEVAGLLSRTLRQMVNRCSKSGTTVIFLNQVRENMAATMFGDPYTTPGGRALRHYSSLRIQIQRKQWYKTGEGIDRVTHGQLIKARVIKSKVCPPMRECEMPFIFERGFVEHEQVKPVIKEIRALLKGTK